MVKILDKQFSLRNRISAHSGALSPQLRRAADYVARHPEEVATRSLRYLANVTKLTPPTYSRLAAALGFRNYEELRDMCRADLKRQQLTYAEKASVLQDENQADAGPEQGVFIMRHGSAAIDNVNMLLKTVDPDQLESVATHLASARNVLLVGSMSSLPFLNYMQYVASMAFENWNVLNLDAGSLAGALSSLNEADVVFAISMAPYAKRSIDFTHCARKTGARMLGITDMALSPLAGCLDISLLVSTESPQFFSSHIATLLLIESVVGMTVARSGKAALKRIADVEATSHEIGEYWPKQNFQPINT